MSRTRVRLAESGTTPATRRSPLGPYLCGRVRWVCVVEFWECFGFTSGCLGLRGRAWSARVAYSVLVPCWAICCKSNGGLVNERTSG
jgi:hypothetical protein